MVLFYTHKLSNHVIVCSYLHTLCRRFLNVHLFSWFIYLFMAQGPIQFISHWSKYDILGSSNSPNHQLKGEIIIVIIITVFHISFSWWSFIGV